MIALERLVISTGPNKLIRMKQSDESIVIWWTMGRCNMNIVKTQNGLIRFEFIERDRLNKTNRNHDSSRTSGYQASQPLANNLWGDCAIASYSLVIGNSIGPDWLDEIDGWINWMRLIDGLIASSKLIPCDQEWDQIESMDKKGWMISIRRDWLEESIWVIDWNQPDETDMIG